MRLLLLRGSVLSISATDRRSQGEERSVAAPTNILRCFGVNKHLHLHTILLIGVWDSNKMQPAMTLLGAFLGPPQSMQNFDRRRRARDSSEQTLVKTTCLPSHDSHFRVPRLISKYPLTQRLPPSDGVVAVVQMNFRIVRFCVSSVACCFLPGNIASNAISRSSGRQLEF